MSDGIAEGELAGVVDAEAEGGAESELGFEVEAFANPIQQLTPR